MPDESSDRPVLGTCGQCTHWEAWSVYYDDPLEPDDCGNCWFPDPPLLGKFSDETCEHFTPAD